jgi:hypothetical protein
MTLQLQALKIVIIYKKNFPIFITRCPVLASRLKLFETVRKLIIYEIRQKIYIFKDL